MYIFFKKYIQKSNCDIFELNKIVENVHKCKNMSLI